MYTVDIRALNNQAVRAVNTGMIILGGGLIKHHICNANLMVGEVWEGGEREGGGEGGRGKEKGRTVFSWQGYS